MSFSSLIQITPKTPQTERTIAKSSRNAKASMSTARDKRGCEFCSANNSPGVNKIFGKVRGKDIFIWAQNPGPQENKALKELVGPSGEFLWKELKRVGIKRKHCDIQNVVRCMTRDPNPKKWPPSIMRAPNKEEIKCCSLYSDKAIKKSKAKVHLVFGAIAGKALLKGELTRDKRVFYSENLKGWVVYLDHPSYFIRQGYSDYHRPANDSLKRFRDDLAKAVALLKKKKSFDRWDFLKSQEYIGVTTRKMARKAYRILRRYALEKNKRLVGDMESGRVDKHGKPDDHGKSVPLCCGFTGKPGTTYVFCLEHPTGVQIDDATRNLNRKLVRKLMRHADIKKAFHYGASDVDAVQELLNTQVKGFDYDTLLGEYFDNPDGYAFGLDAISQRYADFADYKDIIGPDSFTDEFNAIWEKQKGKKKWNLGQAVDAAKKLGQINLARLPWNRMVLYNGADNHLAMLSMRDTKKIVNPPLMRTYVDSSHVLYRMQKDPMCQPLFDYRWHPKIRKLLSLRVKRFRRRICKMAGKYAYVPKKVKGKLDWENGEIHKKKFNPGSGDHIQWLLYHKLGYKFVGKDEKAKPNTQKGTLERLVLKHPKVKNILDFRQAIKARSTYVDGYYKCAESNKGHLATNWWQTGTGTGRLSSGGDKNTKKKDKKKVNLQNIHGDELIQCLLVSDHRWRQLYSHYKKYGEFTRKTWKKFRDVWVMLGLDFSQNELRQLAEESGDEELQKIFASTEKWKCDVCGEMHSADPHCDVGHELTGWSKGKIYHNDRIRKLVKNMQFGLVYGLQGHGLYLFIIALGVETTEDEVNKYHAKYFRRFKKVAVLQQRYRSYVKKNQQVINQFGFRRKIEVNDNREEREEGGKKKPYWGNQAINTPIQGAAHQLLMMALAMLFRKQNYYRLLKYPQLEIHDALYFRVRLKDLWAASKKATKLLTKEPIEVVEKEFKIKKKVPLVAKPKAGFRFGVQVEGIGDGKLQNVWDFLNAWCEENKTLNKTYRKQLAELAA